MINDDIITALRNSVNRGESLEIAMQVLIRSGYSPQEVNEAAFYVSGGVIPNLEPRPSEQLTMPQQRGYFPINQQKINFPDNTQNNIQNNLPDNTQSPPSQNYSYQYPQNLNQQQKFPVITQPQVITQPIQPNQFTQPQQQIQRPPPSYPTPQIPYQQPQQRYPVKQQNEYPRQNVIQQPRERENTEIIGASEKKKESYKLEIILLIILLILIGGLIATIIFKEQILNLFS